MSNSGRGVFSAFNMIANIVRLGYQPTNLDDVQQLLETWTGERWRRTNSNNTDVPEVHIRKKKNLIVRVVSNPLCKAILPKVLLI